jgi:hypothetical protein
MTHDETVRIAAGAVFILLAGLLVWRRARNR